MIFVVLSPLGFDQSFGSYGWFAGVSMGLHGPLHWRNSRHWLMKTDKASGIFMIAIITIGTIVMVSRKGWGNRCELANICFAVSVCGCCLSAITCVCKVLWCKPLQCWCCDTCGMVLVSLACAPAHKLSCISRCEGAHLCGIFTHNSGGDIHKLRSWTRIGMARQIQILWQLFRGLPA